MSAPRPLHILLIDDDPSARITLSALLEDEGFTVDTLSSFTAAMARVAAGPPADAALVDLRLGDGSGADLIGPLRARMPGAKILVVTGERDERLRASSVDAVVEKGCSFPELVAILRRALAG